MRFTTKRQLLQSIEDEHGTFVAMADSIPRRRYSEPGVWGDDWSVKDLFAHLTEWEQMFLRWYREGKGGGRPAVPAPGYKWNQTPELNRAIWSKHRRKSVKRVLAEFDASFEEILSLVRALPQKKLLNPGCFAWTGENALATYLAPNTCNHYRAATRILKRWLRAQTIPGGSGGRTRRDIRVSKAAANKPPQPRGGADQGSDCGTVARCGSQLSGISLGGNYTT